MNDSFLKVLGLSLLVDYFNVCYLLGKQVASERRFLCKKTIASQFANVFNDLNVHYSGYEHLKDEKFMIFEFESDEDKEVVEDYFMNFNHSHRTGAMISFPDLYEGNSEVNIDICVYYLNAIEGFFEGDFSASIAIPAGISEDDPKVRMFMMYDRNKMRGFYKGTQIFQKSQIRFVK